MNLTHRADPAGPSSRSRLGRPASALIAVLLIAGCGTSEQEAASEPTTTAAESEPSEQSASATESESTTESEPAEESASESEAAGESETTSETEAAAQEQVITISDFSFEVPESIPAGSQVSVVNEDRVGHTVTSDEEGIFDVFVGAGEEVSLTVPDEAGEFAFHCTPHPDMTSTLVIG